MKSLTRVNRDSMVVLKRFCLLICLAALLPACSLLINYQVIEWRVKWVIGDYLDWDDTQQDQFESALTRTLQWHQQEQLSQYRQFLTDLQSDLTSPVSFLQLQEYYLRGEQLSNALMAQTLPEAESLLRSLSDRQVLSVLAELDKKTEKLKKKYGELTQEEWRDQRSERIQKQLKGLVGKLSSAQVGYIEEWSAGLVDVRQPWFEQRKIWRDRFESALKQRTSQQFKSEIELLFLRSDDLLPPSYEAQWQRSLDSAIQLMVTIINSLSDKQSEKLNKSMTKYQGYIDRLSNSSPN